MTARTEDATEAAEVVEAEGAASFWAYHWDIVALAAVVVFALAVRLVGLDRVPANVTADEADNLQTVYHILAGTGPGFFGLDWKPAPAFSTHVMAWSLRLFGENIVAMRLPSALLSAAALVPFYFLARRAVPRPIALLTTLLLATSLWYLHFSRSGWENVHGALYGTGAALFLTKGLETKDRRRWTFYAIAGVFCGLGLLGYPSAMFVLAGVFAYLPIAILRDRQRWRTIASGYAIVLAVGLALFAPQAKTIMDSWDYATRRLEVVSIFSVTGDYLGGQGLGAILAGQIVRTFQGFFLMDPSVMQVGLWQRYIPPDRLFLDAWTIVLYWTGLVGSVWRWRQTALWWCMLLALLFPQVLSTGTPDGARGVLVAPFIYLFVALGLCIAVQGLQRLFRRLSQPAEIVAVGVVLALLTAILVLSNVSDYRRWQTSPESLAARHPAVERENYPVWQRMAQQAAREDRLVGEEWPAWLAQNKRE